MINLNYSLKNNSVPFRVEDLGGIWPDIISEKQLDPDLTFEKKNRIRIRLSKKKQIRIRK